MSDTEETSEISSSAKLGLQGLLNANPLNIESNEPDSTNSAENSSRTMNDLQSDSIIPDDKDITSRKLMATGRLNDPEDNASTPAIIDSTSDNIRQGPRRSISESALKDHYDTREQTSTLPVQQDENSTDGDETIDAQVSSRNKSPTVSIDEKHTDLTNEPSIDTDREVTNISRRSSKNKSPLNRPQAPAPDESRKSSAKSPVQPPSPSIDEKPRSRIASSNKSSDEQSKLIKPGEKLQIPKNDIDNKPTNSPPPSPVTKNLISTNPLLANHSRQASQDSTNKQKSIDVDVNSSKSRRNSQTSQQQKPKTNSATSRKSNTASENSKQKSLSRRSSKDSDVPKQQQRQSPYQTEKINSHSSAASSRTITPTNDNLIKQATVPALQTTTDDETQASRPQSPNVEQIAKRNPSSSKSQKQIQAEHRANSVESFNRIQLVDDKSLDSASGINTEENQQTKPRRIKSKKKDAENNTDTYNSNQQQQESTSRKSSKTNKSMTEKSPSIRRHIRSKEESLTPDTEPETTTPKFRHSSKKTKENIENEQIKTSTSDNERQTLSDTEQILGDKQKKRRRPKRISRTTQTYECVFRRMEHDQHDELRPTNDTEKNIQTKKSFLRPRNTSPKKHYPVSISTDELKIEEILPKQTPQQSRSITRTSIATQNSSSPTSKLLLLRPTLPIQHADSLNVQRISVHYNIDLTPKDNKSAAATITTPDLRNKIQTNNNNKPNEEKNANLPNIRPLPNKFNGKEKINTNKNDDKNQQRKPIGNV